VKSLPDAARPFEERADEYDSWYDVSPLFGIELEALQAGKERFVRPVLEVGVGPGRFAQALGIEFGLDPSLSPLQLASSRSIIAINGAAENLPARTGSIGTICLFFTLCFLADPDAAFREFFRALRQEGLLLIGMIPGESPWGKHLAEKGRKHHPFYRFARFRTITETRALLARHRFEIIEEWSTLFQSPAQSLRHEHPRPGADEKAGFCVLVAVK